MNKAPDSRRDCAAFVAVHTVLFASLCLLAQWKQTFHLRLICEGLAIGYLVWFILWAWVAHFGFTKRMLLSLACIAAILLGMKTVLANGFASWFENVIWIAPIVSMLCGAIRLRGVRIKKDQSPVAPQTFSIRSMLLATTFIALAFPLINNLTHSRSAGQFNELRWLIDACVMMAPLSVICVGLIWAGLSKKPFHTTGLLLAAPTSGFLVSVVYGWEHAQSLVIPFTIAAVLVTFSAWFAGLADYRWLRLERDF